jgi:hypothetical protein
LARFKTFDATGIAPNGRLYAGDLNAIQDFLAKQADFTQTVDLSTLRVGDSALQISKYGTGELQVAAKLRVTGIVRSGTGFACTGMTTTQRNALPAGDREPGTIIFNTTVLKFQGQTVDPISPAWVDFN